MKGFSFFCGAGGSSIGYKDAGIDIIGGCDVDKKQTEIYNKYLQPKILSNIPIQGYLINDYDYLYDLDLIDGSPPCTNFSTSNHYKEEHQFKEKKYIEGGISQKLEELVLIYLQVIKKYQPKTFVLENIVNLCTQYGSLLNLYLYNSKIEEDYRVYKIILDPMHLGAYTSRRRLFLIGVKKTLKNTKLDFTLEYYETRTLEKIWDSLEWIELTSSLTKVWKHLNQHKDNKWFEKKLLDKDSVLGVITTVPSYLQREKPLQLSPLTLAKIQGFPYDFKGYSKSRILYAVGMSVHPYCTTFIGSKIKKILF